jgi:molybdopterin-synthase adenylyltransferase
VSSTTPSSTFDVVTDSSLNRLVGAVDTDVAAETKKIAVAERTIKAVKPGATVVTIDGKLTGAEAKAAIARADIVFGCLDRDVHRLELTELCTRYARPCFDLATDTIGEGGELVYGGRVIFCDGTRCLVCLPEILNQEEIARDRMSPEQREADRRIYGVDRDALAGSGPAVVSLNGVVGSLGVTEFMVYVTGLREPASQLIYRGERGSVTKSVDQPEPGCYYCSGLRGSAFRASGAGDLAESQESP